MIKTVPPIGRVQALNRDARVLDARLIGDTAADLATQRIEITIAKDREFIAWCADHPGERIFQPNRRALPAAFDGLHDRRVLTKVKARRSAAPPALAGARP